MAAGERDFGSAAYESLGRALAEFSALADSPALKRNSRLSDGSLRRGLELEDSVDARILRVAKTSGIELWTADAVAEHADFKDAFALCVDEGWLERWTESCASVCERWRAIWRRLARWREGIGDGHGRDEAARIADEYRLERETWVLLGALAKRGLACSPCEPHKFVLDEPPTPAELVDVEARSSEQSRRRACALEWIESCALERARYFAEPTEPLRSEGDAAEGHCALLVLAESPSQLEALASKLWPEVDGLVEAAEAEVEACRATWLLARAGLYDRAADLDERRGAYWRAAAIRAREPSGYDGTHLVGNPRLALWRRCCAARSAASTAVWEASIQRKRAVEDAFRAAAGGADARALGVETRVARAIEVNGRAALYDAALFAALSGNLDALSACLWRIDDVYMWEDMVWARLLCCQRAAARRAIDADDDHDDNDAELAGLQARGQLEAVFLDLTTTQPSSAAFRAVQASLICFGLSHESVPRLLDPQRRGALAEAAKAPSEFGSIRFKRVCAHLGQVWKLFTQSDSALAEEPGAQGRTICDAWLKNYAKDLTRVSRPLCAGYAAALDEPSSHGVDTCSDCFSGALSTAERSACLSAAERAFAKVLADDLKLKCMKQIAIKAAAAAATALDDDDAKMQTLEWLYGELSPCRDGVEALAHANHMLRKWAHDDLERGHTRYLKLARLSRCAKALAARHISSDALDAVLTATRYRGARAPKAARCLKEYLSWRCMVRALVRIHEWRSLLAMLGDARGRSTDPSDNPSEDEDEHAPYEIHVEAAAGRKRTKQRTVYSPRREPKIGSSVGTRRSVRLGSKAVPEPIEEVELYDDATVSADREPLEALAYAAEAARRALELVVCFPGLWRLRRLKWGAAVPMNEDGDGDDNEELVWRLDALCAALAGGGLFKSIDVPVPGWMNLGDDEEANGIRAALMPRVVLSMAHVCKDTADALIGTSKRDWGLAFYAKCVAIPRIVAPSARWQGDDIRNLLEPDGIASLLDVVADAAVQLLRLVPVDPENSEDSVADVDWNKLLDHQFPPDSTSATSG